MAGQVHRGETCINDSEDHGMTLRVDAPALTQYVRDKRHLIKPHLRDRPSIPTSTTQGEGSAMKSEELKSLQAPLKEKYKAEPDAARLTLRAEGQLGEGVSCSIATGKALVEAGLHPATGGSGVQLCSGDMLLQALVACAGVTLSAVATALQIPLESGRLRAEGDLDFRGTLGVSKDAPVGFSDIRLYFDLRSSASEEQLSKLIELTERYCVVLQTLRSPVNVHAILGN